MAKEVHAVVYGVRDDVGRITFTIEQDPASFLSDGFIYDNEEDEWVGYDDEDQDLVDAVYDSLADRLDS